MPRRYDRPKRRFFQERHDVTFQKTAFFIVTAVQTSDLTRLKIVALPAAIETR
jgi:hypothetical protein